MGKCCFRLIRTILLRLPKELNLDLNGGVHVQLARVNPKFSDAEKDRERQREKGGIWENSRVFSIRKSGEEGQLLVFSIVLSGLYPNISHLSFVY